ncbi:MAG: hypothetical protein IJW05_10430 [Lentisphaeria bacterium]|nr:hypothetical protein [Lentisphaeria bacterium]
MIFFSYFLIALALLGWCNFFRLKFRLPFPAALLSVFSSIILLSYLSGLLFGMKIVQWSILWIGIIIFCIQIYQAIRSKRSFTSLIFRKEYLLSGLIYGTVLLVLFMLPHELGYSDVFYAWYPQYLYIHYTGHWSDSEYINYASYYCMLCNAFPAWFSRITGTIVTANYFWALFLLTSSSIGIFLSNFRWKTIPVFGLYLLFVSYQIYILYGVNFAPSSMDALSLLAVVCLLIGSLLVLSSLFPRFITIRFGREKSIAQSEDWRNLLKFIIVMFLTVFCLTGPENFIAYPYDGLLGAYSLAPLVLYIMWMDFGRIHRRGFYFIILWLFVGTLIKPTGIFFFLGVAFIVLLIEAVNIFLSNQRQKKNLFLAFLLLCVPLISSGSWTLYAKANNLNLQHSLDEEWFRQSVDDFNNGISGTRLMKWKNSVNRIGNLYSPVVKLPLVRQVESLIYPVLSSAGMPLVNLSPSNDFLHCSILIIMILIILLISFLQLKKNRAVVLTMIIGASITFITLFIVQYYFAPMYWGVPGLFRYIFPALIMLLGVCILCSTPVIQKGALKQSILMAAMILYPLLIVGMPKAELLRNYIVIDWGEAVWGSLNENRLKQKLYYGSSSREASVGRNTVFELYRHTGFPIAHLNTGESKAELPRNFFIIDWRENVERNQNSTEANKRFYGLSSLESRRNAVFELYRHTGSLITDSYMKKQGVLLLYHRHSHPEIHMPAFTINGEKRYGIYVGHFNPTTKKIEFNHVCAPKKLFENLSRMYGLKNAASAVYPALVCDVKGGFERGAWPAEGWQIVSKRKKLAGPEDDPEVLVEIQRNFFSGNLITVTNRSRENITFRSEQLFSVYPQDIITVKGLLASDGEIMTALSLFALNDGKYKYLKAIYQKNRGVKNELNPFESVIKVNYPFSLNDELYFSVFFVIPPGKTFVLKEIEVLHSSTGQCLTDFINRLE